MYRTTLLALAGLAIASQAKNIRADDADLPILAGLHTIYSYSDTAEPPQELLDLTSKGLVGGIILFGENIDATVTPAGVKALQDAYNKSPAPGVIKALTGVTDAPLLIMTDQEGGEIRRIEDGGPVDSAKVTGQQSDLETAGGQAGSDAATTLKEYNNNANLAPVLDVYFEEGNFIDQYQRSYNNVSDKVALAGVSFVQKMQDAGIAAAAKHFPGLGKAPRGSNTDEVPVTLNVSASVLDAVDIAPFKKAIDAGIHMIMPSWAIYPSVDPEWPSGLSTKWLKDRLRMELGFEGVTVSDAIEAGSLKPFGTRAEVAVRAAYAGMDLLLASARDVQQGADVRQAVEDAVSSGKLDREDFDAATKRIIMLREALGAAQKS